MTMKIDGRQHVAGISILQIRQFFRQVASHHQESFSQEWLVDFLELGERTASRLLDQLIQQTFVVQKASPAGDEYEMTYLAQQLIRSSAAKRVSRATAEEALAGLMSRVQEINSNSKYIYSVRSVVLFGSYLNGKDRLGDVDVGVELSLRIADPDQRTKAHLAYADQSGRRFNTFVDKLYWAEAEIYQLLKGRRRTISIQPWHSFLRMEKDADFKYKVMLGDPDQLARDLSAFEEKRLAGRRS